MPTYDYACTSCGHAIEVVQGINEAPLQVCERCGGQLRRIYHPAGLFFKGPGFYSTDARLADYKRPKGPPKPKAGEPGEQATAKDRPAAQRSD